MGLNLKLMAHKICRPPNPTHPPWHIPFPALHTHIILSQMAMKDFIITSNMCECVCCTVGLWYICMWRRHYFILKYDLNNHCWTNEWKGVCGQASLPLREDGQMCPDWYDHPEWHWATDPILYLRVCVWQRLMTFPVKQMSLCSTSSVKNLC